MRWNPNTPEGEEDTRPTIDDYPHEEMKEPYRKSTYAWNPQEHNGDILRISKSSLGTFNWCPHQYYLEKFEGLRGEQVYYHIRGLNVHDVMEYFWKNIDKSLPDITTLYNEGHIERARAMMNDVVPQPPEPYEYGEEEQIRQWLDWQFERFTFTKGTGWKPVSCEAQVYGYRVIEVDDEPIPFVMSGFIDTIFADGNGFALIELKTGKWKDGSGRKRTAMRKEMQFYKMMLENSPHDELLPITHWGWEFPGGGIEGGEGAHIYYEPTKDARFTPKSVEKSIVKLVTAHIKQEFPASASDIQCGYCDYFEYCPKWTGEDLEKRLEAKKK